MFLDDLIIDTSVIIKLALCAVVYNIAKSDYLYEIAATCNPELKAVLELRAKELINDNEAAVC